MSGSWESSRSQDTMWVVEVASNWDTNAASTKRTIHKFSPPDSYTSNKLSYRIHSADGRSLITKMSVPIKNQYATSY